MALDEAGIISIRQALVSHASRTGNQNRSVLDHEPMGAPGAGLSVDVTEGQISMAPSGLAATSLTWQFAIEFLYPAQQQTYSGTTDVKLGAAVMAFLSSLAADLDLTGAGVAAGVIRRVNVLQPVSRPGWKQIGGSEFRVRICTVDIEINDAFEQGVA